MKKKKEEENFGHNLSNKLANFADDKEPEMQIGLPTDVKHVAHIGIDGASANKPTWV